METVIGEMGVAMLVLLGGSCFAVWMAALLNYMSVLL